MRRLASLALVLACGEPAADEPDDINDTVDTFHPDPDDDGPTVDECIAFRGCVRAGGTPVDCGYATEVDSPTCMEEWCDSLTDSCAKGSEKACGELVLYCAPPDPSGTSSTGDAEDECAGYVGCIEACGPTITCIDKCAPLSTPFSESCLHVHCAALIDECAIDRAACEQWLELCSMSDTTTNESSSSTDSGSPSGEGESSSTSDTGSTGA